MANLEKDIFNAIAAILRSDNTLTSYVNPGSIFLGNRNNVPKTAFPCVFISPTSTGEELSLVPRGFTISPEVLISCVLMGANYDTQIVGDTIVRGILDMVRDVKNAIDVFPGLNYDSTAKRVDKFYFPTTRYHHDFFPFIIGDVTWRGTKLTTGASR